jgi:uncharacterized protein (DUF58 family)
MSYGTHSLAKLDYARYLAACLEFFSSQQRDRVGLVTFDHEIVEYVPPSMKRLDTILHLLDQAEAGRPGSLTEPLLQITELLGRKGILVLISDFYEEPASVLRAIAPLRARGHDVITFHVMDPAELEFPFEDASGFEDLETGEQIPVVPGKLKADYKRMVAGHLEELKTRFTSNRIDYTLLDTSKPLDLALFQYLLARERLSKAR